MGIEERQAAALANTVAWLEDELRDTRATVAKLAQALDQSQTQVWEMTGRLQDVEDAVAALTPQLASIPQLDGELRRLKDVIARAQHEGAATGFRVGELGRQIETAAERQRQALNELAHRLDAIERQAQGAGARFDTLDEAGRRAMEAITLMRQRADEVGRATEALETRLARLTESGARTEQEFARLGGETDSLRKQDEVTAERVHVAVEMIRRLEGQIAQVAAELTVKQDVTEQLELGRVASRRLEERMAGLEATADGLHKQDEESTRLLMLLEGRHKGLQERLAGLLDDFAAYRAQVNDQFQRLHQLQERLKRRQLEDLERDLREIRAAGSALRKDEGWKDPPP